MEILCTKCCGVNEIHRLSDFGKNAEAAMMAFGESQLENNNRFNREVANVKNAVCTHYFFTAAVYPDRDINKDGSISGNNYGKAFANFIEKNDLGVVVESPCAVNKAWHPDHSTVVWLWTPNYENLRDWYSERAGPRMIKRLQDIIKEASQKVTTYQRALDNMEEKHYLRAAYKANLKNAQKELTDAEKALEKAQKKEKAA